MGSKSLQNSAKNGAKNGAKNWWAVQELNLRPLAREASALPLS